jgi:hypothetical protein
MHRNAFLSYFNEVVGDSAKTYACPVPSVWTFEYNELIQFNFSHDIILRDGAASLLHFFKRFPIPQDLNSLLYIHHSMAQIIPVAWHNHIRYFSYYTKHNRKSNKLLLTGVPTSEAIKKLVQNVEVSQFKEILWVLPNHQTARLNYAYYDLPLLEHILNLILEFQNKYQIKIKIISSLSLQERANLNSYIIYPLGSQVEVSDSYYTHLVLSKGAQLIKTNKLEIQKKIELSPYHGIILGTLKEQPDNRIEKPSFSYLLNNIDHIWKKLFTEFNDQYLYHKDLYHVANNILGHE